MSLTRNFRFDPPQHDSQGGADDLRLLEARKVEQSLQNFPVGIGEPDRGFVSQPQIVEMNGSAKSCNPSDSCGEGMALCPNESSESALSAGASPLDWILQPEKKRTPTDRILARLVQAEAHEPDLWLRDDYRQAFITVTLASRGNTMPFVVASYQMYGLHPDKVYSAILARRKALLGPAGAEHSTQPSLQSAPVKKSPKSVTDARKSA